MKGFTPVPVQEAPPIEIPKEPIPPPADIEGTTAFDVMDWGNACNDFVDQLQTGKKRGRRKRTVKPDETPETPNKTDPYTNVLDFEETDNLSTVPVEVLKFIEEPENFSNSSDEDKPLNLLRQQSTPECKDEDSVGARKGGVETSGSTAKSSGSSGDRFSQSIRKKQRLVLEQKLAARIGTGSSSDTEPEDKPSLRARKRKLRTRSSLGMKESDKSDDQQKQANASDDESNSESEEKVVKRISQLDGSSDSDNNQEKSSKKNRSKIQPQKGKHLSVRLSRLSTHEKHSEPSDHSEGDEEKSLPKSKSSKRKSKHSDDKGESSKDETMTRSKRKLEMQKQMSNSKVLRNDKIVQNVTVKKSKNVQEVASKPNKSHNSSAEKVHKKKDEAKNENLKRKYLESDCEQNKSKTKKYSTRKIETSSESSENEEKFIDDKSVR